MEDDVPLVPPSAQENHGAPDSLVSELDALTSAALLAFERKDAMGAMSIYADDLEYTQANGKTITRLQLLKDVRNQLHMISTCKSTSHREITEIIGESLTEISTQHATIEVKVFVLFRKNWNLFRRCKRWWRQTESGWRIYKVEVIEESVV